jgi:hypothetical protein
MWSIADITISLENRYYSTSSSSSSSSTSYSSNSSSSSEGIPLGGLVAWLDASDVTTITKDESDLVEDWRDKLGSTNDAEQATDNNKPLWVDNVRNGNSVIRFDGSGVNGEFLTCPNANNIRTVFFACVVDSSIVTYGGIFCEATGQDAENIRVNGSDTDEWRTPDAIATPGDFTNGGATWMNGVSDAYIHNFEWKVVTAVRASTNSFNYEIGQTASDRWFWGDIGEVIIYNRELSSSERVDVENYLMSKWGI